MLGKVEGVAIVVGIKAPEARCVGITHIVGNPAGVIGLEVTWGREGNDITNDLGEPMEGSPWPTIYRSPSSLPWAIVPVVRISVGMRSPPPL